jgi:pimeloyl-ACP methyl ester carboxylesterase
MFLGIMTARQTLPYRCHGDGPQRVVAIHGWFGDQHTFDALLPFLDGSALTVALPDLRGYGEAIEFAGEFTIDEAAHDVLDLAEQLGWPTFSLVGHSMGGKIAQRIIALAPDKVDRMVGISPVPASGVPFDPGTAALFQRAVTEPEARRQIIDGSTGSRYGSPWLDKMVWYSTTHSREAAFAAYLTSWSGDDFHTEVAGAETPVKIIVGAQDPSLSAEVMRQTLMQWFPRSELTVFADAGHYAIDEVPIATASEIERFLLR